MKKNLLIWLIIVIVNLTTVACSITDWDYLMCQWSGGRWVRGPSSVFDHCVEKNQATDKPVNDKNLVIEPAVVEGAEFTDDPVIEDTSAQVDLQSEQTHAEAPLTNLQTQTTSTYQGSTSIATVWVEAWGGQIIMDEITLHIDSDGIVSGEILSIWESGRSDPILGCVTEQTRTVSATLSGMLTEDNDAIQMQITHVHEIHREGCPAGSETISDAWSSTAQVKIHGDKISGSSEDGLSFEAIRQ